jgi:hypothetical protein
MPNHADDGSDEDADTGTGDTAAGEEDDVAPKPKQVACWQNVVSFEG